MGKSELAIQFGNAQRYNFHYIKIFHYENEIRLKTEYQEEAKKLGIPYREDEPLEDLKRKVHLQLENLGKPWLLILDNVEQQLRLQDLPQRGGSVLITSRHNDVWNDDVRALKEVEPFTPDEAINLLQTLTGEPDSVSARQLAEDLDYLPFAIYQVGSYIAVDRRITIREYRQIFNLSQARLKAPIRTASRYQQVLNNVWNVTLRKLEQENPLAMSWLNICSYFHHSYILIDLLKLWIQLIKKEENCLALTQGVLHSLNKYGLIRYREQKNQFFSIHQLLQEVIHSQPDHQAAALNYYERAEGLIILKIGILTNIEELSVWFSITMLLHLTHLINNGLFSKSDIKIQCELLKNKGEIQLVLADFVGALITFKALFDKIKNKDNSFIYYLSICLFKMGIAFIDLARYQDAIFLMNESKQHYIRMHNTDVHSDIARCLYQSGIAKRKLEDNREAIKDLSEAQRILKVIHGAAPNSDMVSCLNEMALVFANQGLRDKALTHSKDALKMAYDLEGYTAVKQLADTAQMILRFNGPKLAQEMLTDAIKTLRESFGNIHPEVGCCLNDLGIAYNDQRLHKDALNCFDQSLEIYQTLHKEAPHPGKAIALANRGITLAMLKRTPEGVQALDNALEEYKRVYGPKHPEVANCLYQKAVLLALHLKRGPDALECCRECLSIYRLHYSNDNHYDIQLTLKLMRRIESRCVIV